MAFYCQRNCYSKQLSTKVKSCKAAAFEEIIDGKKVKRDCYNVIFDDTVLFPEGGGQPYDTGTVNGISVLKVLRNGADAIHYMTAPLEEGDEVTQCLDWSRRHDHMQQHSGQHLVTALADSLFGFKTLSWSLGPKISYIELDTPKISKEDFDKLEFIVNEKIREALPVIIKEYEASDPELKEVRTRGLPDNVSGPVRVVSIRGLDNNMCCGTHVSHLGDLQLIKLTHTEKGKLNKLILYFICGQRVINTLRDCLERETELTSLLHSNPIDHCRLVEKAKKDLKSSTKSFQDALKDIAVFEAAQFEGVDPRPKYFEFHRRDGDVEFLRAIVKNINDDSVLKVLSCGEDNGPSVLIVDGPKELVENIGPRLCTLYEGKGGGKTRFTGKISNVGVSKRKEASRMIKKLFLEEEE